jgi:putative SbcD/Mre11-related phosphoesterase
VADGLLAIDDVAPWLFAPEGAVVHPEHRVAVVADIHLGYEWARAKGGDVLPAHTLDQTRALLNRLFARVAINRLVLAGDIVESRKPCSRTRRDVESLITWLDRKGIESIRVRGNHDSHFSDSHVNEYKIDGWTIHHGHAIRDEGRFIIGHFHPAFGFEGMMARCFLVSARCIVLPAFSTNAAGFDVGSGQLPAPLRSYNLRCIASSGEALFDFGPIHRLKRLG